MTPEQAHALVMRALEQAAPHLDVATVGSADDFRDDLELDSLDFLSFIEALAGESGVEVPEKDYSALTSVETTAAYLVNAAVTA
jgi:acyl carrier protein